MVMALTSSLGGLLHGRFEGTFHGAAKKSLAGSITLVVEYKVFWSMELYLLETDLGVD